MKSLHTCAILLAAGSAAIATPSGLNNIPTADTVPQGTFVLQTFSTVGDNRDADLNLGFKTGIDLKAVKLELGLAAHLYPGLGGPVTPHAKIAVPLGEGLPVIAGGVANISFRNEDRRRAGDEFAYGVISQDFGWFRMHAGCGAQDGEALPFVGLDKTFRIAKSAPAVSDGKSMKKHTAAPAAPEMRDLFTLRTDAIRLRNHDWLLSAGVLVPVCKNFVFETWGNFPTDGTDASLTLKANFVFSF